MLEAVLQEPVRLLEGEFDPLMPVVIPCGRPRCSKLWTVRFPPTPPVEDARAVWRLQTSPQGRMPAGAA